MSAKLKTITVADFAFGIQGWAGQSPPDSKKLLCPAKSAEPEPKPARSLFTSSYDPLKRSTPWLDHLRARGQRTKEGRCLWALKPDPQAMLYMINSLEDYKQLADAYPKRWDHPNVSPNNPAYAPDWYQIGNPGTLPFDGVHVTEEAIAAGNAQHGHPKFEAWDVESTLWFTLRFVETELLGALRDDWILVN